MVSFWLQAKDTISSFNLYHDESDNERIVRCQRVASRIFLVLFFFSTIVLLVYTWISERTIKDTVQHPDRAMVERLQVLYPDTLNCPCDQIVIPYPRVVDDNITYHPICSSQFVTQEWIERAYQANTTYIWPLDIRSISSAFGQILRSFCSLSKTMIGNAQNLLGSQSLITTSALSPEQFDVQARSLSEFIRKSTSINLNLMLVLIRGIMGGNQPISGLGTNVIWQLYKSPVVHRMMNAAIVYGGVPFIGGGCLCSVASVCTAPAGYFPDVEYTTNYRFSQHMYNGSTPASIIPGWKGGCYPFEAASLSTLECFYNSSCLKLLVSTRDAIRPLSTNGQKHPISTTILSLLEHLFVDEWNSTIDYGKYLNECAPKRCTYSYVRGRSFIEIITILFGLIGGLMTGLKIFVGQIILRLLVFIVKRRSQRQVLPLDANPIDNIPRNDLSTKQRLFELVRRGAVKIIAMNLFSTTVWLRREQVRRQLWTSRIFVLSMALAFLVETIFISLEETTREVTIIAPNQTLYESLLNRNLRSFQCPCTHIAIEHKHLFNIVPVYHQICSSPFTDHNWYSRLKSVGLLISHDFRWSASAQFQLLNLLCLIASRTVDAAFRRFQITPLIAHHVLEPTLFELRARVVLNNFIKTTTTDFSRTLRLLRSLTASSQFITLAGTNAFGHVTADYLAFYKQSAFEAEALLKPECYCARDFSCQKESSIYDFDIHTHRATPLFNVSGFIMACFPLDSLLGSSFECLHDETCINHTLSFFPDPLIPRVTLAANKSTRFDHRASADTIANELFIEDWQTTQSYASFYKQCLPSHCIYSVISKNGLLLIITSSIALYGGLNAALKLILPHMVNLLSWLIRRVKMKQIRCTCQEQHFSSCLERVRSRVVEFNLFASSLKDVATVREQRIATRLFVIILTASLVSLVLYKGLSLHTLTTSFKQPSEEQFEHLHEMYGHSLQCAASSVSVDYALITNITYSTHQICTSDLLRKNFTDYLFHKIVLPLPQNDVRSHALSFFHLLNALCSQTQDILNDSLSEFARTPLISTHVLSPRQFQSQTGSVLHELKETLSFHLLQSLKIFRDHVQGNQLITLSGSNWRFAVRYQGHLDLLRSVPVVRSNCSCATSNRCFEPATLYTNGNDTLAIRGLYIGCTPLDSLFSSTLECFYEQSCVADLIEAFRIPFSITALPSNGTQFAAQTTVEVLLKNLFIEHWRPSAAYSKYYAQARPVQCFYSYAKRSHLLNVVVELLGLYGGLNVALHFIVPILVRFAFKIQRRCRHQTPVVTVPTANTHE